LSEAATVGDRLDAAFFARNVHLVARELNVSRPRPAA